MCLIKMLKSVFGRNTGPASTDTGTIQLTDSNDIAFANIAQNSIVQNTALPSGFKTPDRKMRIDGTKLVPC